MHTDVFAVFLIRSLASEIYCRVLLSHSSWTDSSGCHHQVSRTGGIHCDTPEIIGSPSSGSSSYTRWEIPQALRSESGFLCKEFDLDGGRREFDFSKTLIQADRGNLGAN